MANPNVSAEVVSVSPRVPGKSYYKQPSPSKRGFKSRGFYVSLHEANALDQDAEGFPSAAAYLRHLWEEDRKRRGLPVPIPQPQEQ